jgi:acetoacetate decarboxylase
MKRDEILSASSMPLFSPSYLRGPFRFIRREYLIITYRTDPAVIRAALPEPLQPAAGDLAYYEWMKMPDATGFGVFQESGGGLLATLNGEACNFSVQMYLNDEPPISGGREIWGFPKKYGIPQLKTIKDTLTGTLHYDEERVALGTMAYKQVSLADQLDQVKAGMAKLNVNLKWIPDVDGKPKIAQLVGYNLADITVHEAWEGAARLSFTPHANCRVADLPVREVVGGRHLIVDFVLPYGRVLHDYLAT